MLADRLAAPPHGGMGYLPFRWVGRQLVACLVAGLTLSARGERARVVLTRPGLSSEQRKKS